MLYRKNRIKIHQVLTWIPRALLTHCLSQSLACCLFNVVTRRFEFVSKKENA